MSLPVLWLVLTQASQLYVRQEKDKGVPRGLPVCGAWLRKRACWSGRGPFHLEGKKLMLMSTVGLLHNTETMVGKS